MSELREGSEWIAEFEPSLAGLDDEQWVEVNPWSERLRVVGRAVLAYVPMR